MGFLKSLSSLFGFGKKQIDIIVVGLDNSGKTTILNQLKTPDARTTTIVPTVGYTVQNFTVENFSFNAFDMAGQSKYRNVWETYYITAQAVLFVVDSTDRVRMAVARDELWTLIDHRDIGSRQLPILVLANKTDLPDAITSAEMSQQLGLDVIRGSPWGIFSTCALTGKGLVEAMEWLHKHMTAQIEKNNR